MLNVLSDSSKEKTKTGTMKTGMELDDCIGHTCISELVAVAYRGPYVSVVSPLILIISYNMT